MKKTQQKSTMALKMKTGSGELPAIPAKNSEKVKDMATPFSQNKKNAEFYKLS